MDNWATNGSAVLNEFQGDVLFAMNVASVGHGRSTGDILCTDPLGTLTVNAYGIPSNVWQLATNVDVSRWARGICQVIDEDAYTVWYRVGPYNIPAHGLGSRGDQLWLGDEVFVVGDDPPSGGTPPVLVHQRLGEILDEDWIFWQPFEPVIFGA